MANIIVSFPKLENAENIKAMLIRNGMEVAGVCCNGAQTLALAEELQSGVIVCGCKFQDMMCSELRGCLPEDFEVCMVASKALLTAYPCEGVICLEMPLKARELVETLDLLCYNIDRKLRKKKSKPKKRSEKDQGYIKKAKEILMERNHMTEEEAHRYLQKCSMDSGTNLVETAQMLLSLMKD